MNKYELSFDWIKENCLTIEQLKQRIKEREAEE